MIVVDTNVIAYLYIPGEFSAAAEDLLEREPEWSAPLLWRSEFRNILAGYLRRKALSLREAAALLAEAEDFMAGAEFEVDSRRVLELVDASDCSAYDCEFVALAQARETRLVTLDKKLLKAFPRVATTLKA